MEGRYHRMRLLLALLLFLAFPASAEEDPFRPEWTAVCKLGDTDFSVRFKSKSGQAEQDDQFVTLVWGRRKGIVLPVEPALYASVRFKSDAKNYCRGIGAFDWPQGRLLLLIAQNSRPSDDQIVAVVIDTKTGNLVQDVGTLGAISQAVLLLRHGSGYRLMLERSWHVDPTDGGEFPAPEWMLLAEKQGRLIHRWQIPRE